MICAHCGSETAESPCSGCARSPLLGGRYRLLRAIEQTEQERVYQGEDSRSGGAVLLRRIDTRRVTTADLARSLDTHLKPLLRIHHPGLPRRRRCETTQGGVWTIRSWVNGPSLAEHLPAAGPLRLGVALDTTDRLLENLEVLHEQSPPFPHGALRPTNVRLDEKGRPVLLGRMGTLPLLRDPGHPQRPLREDPTGLAPEQRGDVATIRADLYAAGALCIAMLTGRPSTELERGGRIAWEQVISVPPALGGWLDRLIDPAAGRRPGSAALARQQLHDIRAQLPDTLLRAPAPPPQPVVEEEQPTMVVRQELPTSVGHTPVRQLAHAEWPSPDATPTSSGRRPAPADLAPTSLGRRPTPDEIASAEPTTIGQRPSRADLAAAEPTTIGQRPSHANLTPPSATPIRRRRRTPADPAPRRPAAPTPPPPEPPTDAAPRPGPNPFESPTGFARRASEIEHTGPRPPTLVRPPSEPRRGSVFENPVFVAVGLALLIVALWQVISRLSG